jgi:hypothetical protein
MVLRHWSRRLMLARRAANPTFLQQQRVSGNQATWVTLLRRVNSRREHGVAQHRGGGLTGMLHQPH